MAPARGRMPNEGDVELFSSLSFHNIYLMQFNSSGLLAALRILLCSSQSSALPAIESLILLAETSIECSRKHLWKMGLFHLKKDKNTEFRIDQLKNVGLSTVAWCCLQTPLGPKA